MNPQGPVMDVQRPRPKPAPSEVKSPLDNSMAPADNIASMTPDPLQQTASPAKNKKSHKGLIIGIVTAVVVLMIGAGVAGFIIYKNNNKPAPAAVETQSESERVNVAEIDGTITEIDKTLNTLNDSSDVTPNDVTDSSIGL